MENKRIIPKEYIGMKIVERPPKFQAPQYTCAMTMDIVLFLSDQIYEDQRKDLSKLLKSIHRLRLKR